MNKVGKATVYRVEWGRWVVSSIRIHKGRLLERLDGRMGLDRAGWDAYLSGQSRELSEATEALWVASQALAYERSDDPGHREERDRCVRELLEQLGRTRSLLASIDPRLVERFGLDGELPRVPKALESLGHHVMGTLRSADQKYSLFGMDVSTVVLADELEPYYRALHEMLMRLHVERSKAEGLLIDRDRALRTWTRVYRAVAGLMESIYGMVEEDELAKRVRPTAWSMEGKVGPEDGEDVQEQV